MKANGVWMMATGGASELTARQRESAEHSFDNYRQRQEQRDPGSSPGRASARTSFTFESYVAYTQEKNAERIGQLQQHAATLDFADGGLTPEQKQRRDVTAPTGAYVVEIDGRGDLYQIDRRTTGLYPAQVEKFLAPMDAKPVPSVTAARQIVRRPAAGTPGRHRRGPRERARRREGKPPHRRFPKSRHPAGLEHHRRRIEFCGEGIGEPVCVAPMPKTAPQREEDHRPRRACGRAGRTAAARADYDAEHDSTKARQQGEQQREQIAAEQYKRLQQDRGEGRERER